MYTLSFSSRWPLAFAAVVAGAITGTSLRGETREASLAETCSHAAWPQIPPLPRRRHGHEVRFVTANTQSMDPAMRFRFGRGYSAARNR